MTGGTALAVLLHALEQGGDIDVAYAAIARLDPLVRPRVRRKVRAAYYDAHAKTRVKRGDEGRGHLMRLAYLDLAGVPVDASDIDDMTLVLATFEATRAGRNDRLPRFWWGSATLVLGLFLLGGLGAVSIVFSLGPALRPDASLRPAPSASGAFATGGRPGALNPVVTRLLAKDLPNYLIALDRWKDARAERGPDGQPTNLEAALNEAQSAVVKDDVRRELGERATRGLEEIVTRARAAAEAPSSARGDALMTAIGGFDDELASRGVGGYLDGDVIEVGDRRLVLVYSFAVERVTLFEAAGFRVRALELRRLDHLNWAHTLLGFSRPHLGDALVLLDQLDEQLVTEILPALGAGARMGLLDAEEWEDALAAAGNGETKDLLQESIARVEARAGELVRREYGAGKDVDGAVAEHMGRLLERRAALIKVWQEQLRPRGLVLSPPSALQTGSDYLDQLRGVVPARQLEELTAIDEKLGSEEFVRAFARLRDLLAASVARHEVQHRLDFARRAPLPLPAELSAYMGVAQPDGPVRPSLDTARGELSAYLAELARDDKTTGVNLSMITRLLLKPPMQGTPECYAALVIFDGLAAELSLGRGARLVEDAAILRSRVADLYLQLTDRPPSDLRAAATRLWGRLFGGALSELRTESTNFAP